MEVTSDGSIESLEQSVERLAVSACEHGKSVVCVGRGCCATYAVDVAQGNVPAIIDQGFMEFVESRGTGPLFYNRTSGDRNKKHASKSVCNRVAAWVRQQDGFDDPRKAPNHALRHWFKTTLGALEVPDSMSDSIVGHGKRSEADTYRQYTVRMKAAVLGKVQVPGVTTSDRTTEVE